MRKLRIFFNMGEAYGLGAKKGFYTTSMSAPRS